MNQETSKRKDSENLAIRVTFSLSSSSVIEFRQGKTISIRLEGTIGKQVLRLWILEGTIKSRHKETTIKSSQLERTIEVTNGANGQDVPKDERQSTDASKERTYARHYYVNLKPLLQEGTTKSRHQEEKTIRIQNQPSLVENLRGVLTTSLSPTMLKLSGINQVTVVQVYCVIIIQVT